MAIILKEEGIIRNYYHIIYDEWYWDDVSQEILPPKIFEAIMQKTTKSCNA
jgi:hypothetical protein